MLRSAFTELVGCTVPIQQAGVGGVATPSLAAAVADAGGLGMLAAPMMPAAAVAAMLDDLGRRTAGQFGVNFLMPFLDRDAVAVAAGKCRVVEFFYADPDASLIDMAHAGGALACWQVGSVAEAQAAADVGCDLVVAQGIEAGGHVRGEVGLMPLLAEVLNAVDLPVIAAGGIASARSMAGCLAAGAAAVRVGTRFVACHEADVHHRLVVLMPLQLRIDRVEVPSEARAGDEVRTCTGGFRVVCRARRPRGRGRRARGRALEGRG